MSYAAIDEVQAIASTAAHINNTHTQTFFIRRNNCGCSCQLIQNQACYFQTGFFNTTNGVADSSLTARHDMHVGFQADA
ncbi:hypothetical protein D3C72_1801710 [compost metagenome]